MMTKYQMIFVKIEVYLMNFYHIYQQYNYPLVRFAFNKIKRVADSRLQLAAVRSLTAVGKLKRVLRNLSLMERRRKVCLLTVAMECMKECASNADRLNEIKHAKTVKIKRLRENLSDRREEIESLQLQVEEARVKSKVNKKEADTKQNQQEVKRIQLKILKEEERRKKLKASIRATEEKILSFIENLNRMLDSHEDFFAGNDQFGQIWSEFLNNKQFTN